ncbi:MAG: sulfatase-like hydrolase/transferase [Candidatus Latescibacteria bacterium]|nr:sulfatase-like hydrolase/transferase [Candidatus Latescibacterota bacterium]
MPRPNILLLQSDEHSYRFLSARPREKGGEPCHTPTLDGLIAQGAHFESAYCQMPLCSPSRIAMLSGRHAHRAGAWNNNSILPPENPTFANHLGEHGYATCNVGKLHLGGSRQLAGFQHRPYGDFGGPCAHQFDPLDLYEEEGSRPGMDMRSRTQDAGLSQIPESMLQEQIVARESTAWLRQQRHQNPDQPWLLYASFSRPHFPLTAPSRHLDRYLPDGVTPPRVRRGGDSAEHPMTLGAIRGFRTEEIDEAEMMKARAAYFACVDFLDEILGDFLAQLQRDGALENTVIIYTSDHGELCGEHGLFWKNTWHEASARVPLIISTPEHRRGEIAASAIIAPASLADIYPTLCGLSGTPLANGLDGVDLSPAVRGDSCPALENRPGVITESVVPRWGAGTEFRMIRDARYKYVAFRDCDDLAFDLQEDPDEQVNLVDKAQGDVAQNLADLKNAVLKGFSFAEAEVQRKEQVAELAERFPARVECRTPNQILRGDGKLVEADAALYEGEVVSSQPTEDFS